MMTILGISCQPAIKYFAMFHEELIINHRLYCGWSAEGPINLDITFCSVIRALDSNH